MTVRRPKSAAIKDIGDISIKNWCDIDIGKFDSDPPLLSAGTVLPMLVEDFSMVS